MLGHKFNTQPISTSRLCDLQLWALLNNLFTINLKSVFIIDMRTAQLFSCVRPGLLCGYLQNIDVCANNIFPLRIPSPYVLFRWIPRTHITTTDSMNGTSYFDYSMNGTSYLDSSSIHVPSIFISMTVEIIS